MHTANRITPRLARPLSAALLGTAALWASPALAQQAAGGQVAAAELPPVVVQGATLEAKHSRPAKASGAAAGDDEPPAKPRSQKKPAAAAPAPAASVAVPGIEVVTAAQEGAATGGGIAGGVPADRLGTSVSVVTGEELKERQIQTVADALRSLPGVAVSQQGGTGSVSVARIRGGESRHTLVLIDGVEVNAATDGLVDFANLSTADISRIEVLRGPQSGIYGTDRKSVV